MKTVDRKFIIKAINPCNQKTYTEKNAILFCAKDQALPAALAAYIVECERIGCGVEHIESVRLLLARVYEYQENVDVKVPDTETDCEINRCIYGKLETQEG